MEEQIQSQVSLLIGKYGWLFLVGVLTLLFRGTIEKFVSGMFVFMGNDYNEDDVVEVDGKPGRIVRVGMWTTTFFTYDVRDGIIVGGAKLVIQNDKLKDIKIEKPLPLLDLSKYKVDTTCNELLTELTKIQTITDKCNNCPDDKCNELLTELTKLQTKQEKKGAK